MRFPEWKAKAVTLSYDDGIKTDKRLIDIMNKNGLKGTFNINSGFYDGHSLRMSKEQAFELYTSNGMEVAAHGLKHISADCLPEMGLFKEYGQDKENLENTYDTIIRGYAYPNSIFNDRAVSMLKECGFAYARTTIPSYQFSIPTDWLRLKPTCHHNDPKLQELTESFIQAKPDSEYRKYPLLFYVWGHTYEFDNNNNWNVIEEFAEKIGKCEGVWHATNIEIYDYVKAYENLAFSANYDKVLNNSAIDVYLLVDGKKVLAKSGKLTKI